MSRSHLWWQSGVIYQLYPRSFMDTDGDGIGDLRGIVSRLYYLERLGVDALWLSPIYRSPMADLGYDVSDYTEIDPLFGTIEDFDSLLDKAHRVGLKVILDFVPNHTSDEHPWFVESRSSRASLKRDWYIWRDPKLDGAPPNNWLSMFGDSAWTFDEATGQYYLHSFDFKQPDLNWRNPKVRSAMYDAMRFWLERGVDGFRVDAVSFLIKDRHFRDNPPNPHWCEGDRPSERLLRIHSEDLLEVHEVVREMRKVVNAYDEGRLLIGEAYLPLERTLAYHGEDLGGMHMPFNFELVVLREWRARAVRRVVDAYEAALPERAWPNWVLGNHDRPRIVDRIGPAQARVAQMLLLTLRGTPTCYYGDEIGMHAVELPEHLVFDPGVKNQPGSGRAPARTPMQWDPGPNAGFCEPDVTPWLPVADDHTENNVENQTKDSRSMLSLFRRLIELRRQLPALTAGAYRSLETGNDAVFAYLREDGDWRVLVALNFEALPQHVNLPPLRDEGDLLCSTHLDRRDRLDLRRLELRPNEGIVLALQPGPT